MSRFAIEWLDSGLEPKHAPNPDFPHGMDIDLTGGREPSCTVPLVCPAKRCGAYRLRCLTCGLIAMVTTAGRSDDPKSATVACKP